jgi:protein SCO1/2
MARVRYALAAGLLAAAVVAGAAADSPRPADQDRALRTSQEAIGRAVGDHTLLAAGGRTVRLADYRGQPVVMSFVYTGCFDVCPTATRFLEKAVQDARAALGADTFHVVTVGFNAPFDTPDAMAAFARQNGIRDPGWEFVSAGEATIAALARDLGFTYFRTAAGFDHIAQVTVLDAQGTVYRQIYGESFDLPLLVGPLKQLLAGEAVRSGGLDGLWQRVKLFCTVYDPASGAYRANYSLFFEIFAGASVLLAIAVFVLRESRRSRATRSDRQTRST